MKLLQPHENSRTLRSQLLNELTSQVRSVRVNQQKTWSSCPFTQAVMIASYILELIVDVETGRLINHRVHQNFTALEIPEVHISQQCVIELSGSWN